MMIGTTTTTTTRSTTSKPSSPVERVLSRLPDRDRVTGSNGQYEARCPCHDDRRNSLSIGTGFDGRALIDCKAGCRTEDILLALDLSWADTFVDGHKPREKHIEATYDYHNEAGKLIFQVVKYRLPNGDKDFKQRHPDGAGGWIWNTKGVKKTLYRLPAIIDAVKDGRPVYITEGEKAAELLVTMGLEATCSPGGAGKWRPHHGDHLHGAHVAILPDNDEPGRSHAEDVARALYGKAADVKILELQDLPAKGDAYDWAVAAKTGGVDWSAVSKELIRLANETKFYAPPVDLPDILGKGRQLPHITNDALAALTAANDPPSLFIRDGRLAGVASNEEGRPIIQEWTAPKLRGRLSRVARWYYLSNGKDINMMPPRDVVEDIMSLGEWPLPALKAVTETPILRPDGSISTSPGYDAETRLYYVPTPGLVLPTIPDYPEKSHLEAAIETFNDVIQDFPFVKDDDNASKAHVYAAALTIVMRHLIDGNAPIFMLDKTKYGTGASLLCEVVGCATTGRHPSMMTTPGAEGEMRKRITSILRNGTTISVLDNVSHNLKSDALSAVVTAHYWEDRKLGVNETLRLPTNNTTWILTGNNLRVRGDLARRVVWSRLDAQMSRPWIGRQFTHNPLLAHVRKHRAGLLAALLTIGRAWIRMDQPAPTAEPMGSFEEWCHVIGGALELAGVKGFLENRDTLLDTLDDEHTEWSSFLAAIHEHMNHSSFTTRKLADLIRPDKDGNSLNAELTDTLPGGINPDDKHLSRSLGNLFNKRTETRYDGLRLVKTGEKNRAKLWTVIKGEGCPKAVKK